MFHSHLRLLSTIFAIVALSFACERQAPVSPGNDNTSLPALRPHVAISTTAQFEAAWNGGDFVDGTVFQIAADTLEWTTDVSFTATNKTFSLVGVDTTSVLKRTYSNGVTPFFSVIHNGAGEDSLIISNLKFVRNGNGNVFGATYYSKVDITNVVVDVGGNSFLVMCDILTIDGFTLRANYGPGLHHKNRPNQAFSHVIRNSSFRRKVGGSGPCKVDIISPGDGSVTWDNNEFFATTDSDGEEFYDVQVSSASTEDISFTFTDNNFRKQNILFNLGCNDATVNVLLDGNNSDLVFCSDGVGVGELIECARCGVSGYNFDLVVTGDGWSFDGDPFDYDDFGPISNQNACYVAEAESVFVEFSLGGTTIFGDSRISASVLFADDNCTTGVTEVAAWWNTETLKWNSAFDVSGITDTDCYWRGMGVLCDKTVMGTCIRKRFEECGGGGGVKPEWFTYP